MYAYVWEFPLQVAVLEGALLRGCIAPNTSCGNCSRKGEGPNLCSSAYVTCRFGTRFRGALIALRWPDMWQKREKTRRCMATEAGLDCGSDTGAYVINNNHLYTRGYIGDYYL